MVNESVGWMVRAAVNPDESSAPTLPTVVIPVAASGVQRQGHRRRGIRAEAALEISRLIVVEYADAQGRDILDQGDVGDGVDDVVGRIGTVGVGRAAVHGHAEVVEIGLFRDGAYQAAHRAGAIQRPLGATQYFDVIEIQNPRIDRIR